MHQILRLNAVDRWNSGIDWKENGERLAVSLKLTLGSAVQVDTVAIMDNIAGFAIRNEETNYMIMFYMEGCKIIVIYFNVAGHRPG